MDPDSVAPLSEMSPEQAKLCLREIERADPELWKRCYPRHYRPYKEAEYPSAKIVAQQLFSIAMKVEMGYMGQSEKYEMMWGSQLAKYGMKQYWVTRDLAEAILHTTPPMKVDWYNMPMSFPAISFLLPRGFLTHKEEGNVTFISFARFKINDPVRSLARGGPPLWSSVNGSMIFLANTEFKYLTHWNMPYDAFPEVDLAALNTMVEKYDQNEHTTGWLEAPQMTKEDTRIGGVVAHLIFGLLLFMARKPEIITQGTLLKRVARRGEAPKEFWTAPVLGRDYKIRRVPGPNAGSGGTHASPREHWVRGYWKDQPYGVGNSLRKEVLIDPYLRGGE